MAITFGTPGIITLITGLLHGNRACERNSYPLSSETQVGFGLEPSHQIQRVAGENFRLTAETYGGDWSGDTRFTKEIHALKWAETKPEYQLY